MSRTYYVTLACLWFLAVAASADLRQGWSPMDRLRDSAPPYIAGLAIGAFYATRVRKRAQTEGGAQRR